MRLLVADGQAGVAALRELPGGGVELAALEPLTEEGAGAWLGRASGVRRPRVDAAGVSGAGVEEGGPAVSELASVKA